MWELHINITVSISYLDHNKSENFILIPGVGVEWENVKITITSVTQPPMPLLGKRFMTDKNFTYIVPASEIDNLVPGVIGDLQCATELDAYHMTCKSSPHICVCHPQDTTVTCACH